MKDESMNVAIVARTTLVFLLLTQFVAPAGAQQRNDGTKPTPDLAEVSYGPHKRNVLDLWKAKSQMPTPLVVFIHGGGFQSGSKEALPTVLLEGLLARDISVMAINYRLSPEVSFPAHYMDCARAIQLLAVRQRNGTSIPIELQQLVVPQAPAHRSGLVSTTTWRLPTTLTGCYGNPLV
jgi:acetyl esterase/lipase